MKKPLIYLLSLGLVLSLTSGIDTTYAVGTEESEATVEFEIQEEAIAPVDPMEPGEPNPDAAEQGNITGDTDPLSLDFVSNIDFGSHEVDLEGDIYEAETAIPYIQVTDRRGPGEGWHVTAAANQFTNGAGGPSSLPGATINFNNGEADSVSSSAAPTVTGEIELITGGDPVQVVTSSGGAQTEAVGLGTWVVRWIAQNDVTTTNDSVTLDIPAASATEGSHTTTIDWTLTDGPTGSTDGL